MSRPHPLRWAILGFAALFYFYEFFIRVSPSVMVPELMEAFRVNATAIGALSGLYFYAYGPMQIPIGMLTDRYGVRRLLGICALAAGVGTLLFTFPNYGIASLGRLLQGVGSSIGFVGIIYVSSHWFPTEKRGLLIGLANAIGMLGAIMGEGPLRLGLDQFGWRPTIVGLSLFGVLLSSLIFIFVRYDPVKKAPPNKQVRIGGRLLIVCKNPSTWLNGFAALFLYVATPSFAGLWAIPFFTTKYGYSIELSGFIASMMFVGWAVGGAVIGKLSDYFRVKKPILVISSFCALLLMALIVYAELSTEMLFVALALLGFTSASQLLNFVYAIDVNPVHTKGTATAFTNFLAIMGSAILQPFVGSLLDSRWTGGMSEGIRIYSVENYTYAMSTFVICFLLAFVLNLFAKRVRAH